MALGRKGFVEETSCVPSGVLTAVFSFPMNVVAGAAIHVKRLDVASTAGKYFDLRQKRRRHLTKFVQRLLALRLTDFAPVAAGALNVR